jgi:hypothetical protein
MILTYFLLTNELYEYSAELYVNDKLRFNNLDVYSETDIYVGF